MRLIREIRDKAGGLVFRRWELLRTPWFSLFLHGMYDRRGDRDDHCHDHPWSFLGMVLWGGYDEVVHDTRRHWFRRRGPLSVARMPGAGRYHRVLRLLRDRSYSLVLASRKTRPWGYWTQDGWIENREYRDRRNAGTLPNQGHAIRVIGLTGGIATGKTHVARILEQHGVPVIDADLLSRKVMWPGQPAHEEVVREFGPQVLAGSHVPGDRSIDRRKLGALVFADPAKRKRLEEIVHPRIRDALRLELRRLRSRGHRLAVYDAALVVETGTYKGLDGLIVTRCSREEQVSRLVKRDALTHAEAEARLAAQMPADDKARYGDWVVDTSRSRAATRRQVERIAGLLE